MVRVLALLLMIGVCRRGAVRPVRCSSASRRRLRMFKFGHAPSPCWLKSLFGFSDARTVAGAVA
eukprot:8537097-Lingulodinium_polyedra.AAC.1